MEMVEERIAFKRFYVGKASLFGLYYGAAIGAIVGVVMFLVTTLSGQAKFYFGNVFNVSGVSLSFMMAVISFVGISLSTLVLFVIFSLVYNLVSRVGGAVHFELGETDMPQPTATFNSASNVATAVPAAMAQGAQLGFQEVQQTVQQGVQQVQQGVQEAVTGQAAPAQNVPQQVQSSIPQAPLNMNQQPTQDRPNPNRARMGTANYMDHRV